LVLDLNSDLNHGFDGFDDSDDSDGFDDRFRAESDRRFGDGGGAVGSFINPGSSPIVIFIPAVRT
jgi:hypothetical protein